MQIQSGKPGLKGFWSEEELETIYTHFWSVSTCWHSQLHRFSRRFVGNQRKINEKSGITEEFMKKA